MTILDQADMERIKALFPVFKACSSPQEQRLACEMAGPDTSLSEMIRASAAVQQGHSVRDAILMQAAAALANYH